MLNRTLILSTAGILIFPVLMLSFVSLVLGFFFLFAPFSEKSFGVIKAIKAFLLCMGGPAGAIGLILSLASKGGCRTNILLLYGLFSFLFVAYNGSGRHIPNYVVPLVLIVVIEHSINNFKNCISIDFKNVIPPRLFNLLYLTTYFLSYLYLFNGYIQGRENSRRPEMEFEQYISIACSAIYFFAALWVCCFIYFLLKRKDDCLKWLWVTLSPFAAFIIIFLKFDFYVWTQ
jgi:hypothetical protein